MTDMLNTLVERARQAYLDEEYDDSAQFYADAATQYQVNHDEINAAEMQNNRSVSLLRAGKAQAAFEAAQNTETVFAKCGDLRRQALALGNQAAALDALKQGDKALTLYLQSADLLKQAGDKESRSYVMQSIAGIYFNKGKRVDAIIAMNTSLEDKPHLTMKDKLYRKLFTTMINLMGR